MTVRQTLEEVIAAALLHHADAAHLPLSTGRVHIQAQVAARAAEGWVAAYAAEPMGALAGYQDRKYQRRALPGPADLPPDGPTAPGQRCTRPDCSTVQASVGWRWYIADGWTAVCTRHMGGMPRVGRRYNTEYTAATQ